jgi:Kef-type K+ transport system membrane component KefB/nucleotide-binding universal stress UspA family protein
LSIKSTHSPFWRAVVPAVALLLIGCAFAWAAEGGGGAGGSGSGGAGGSGGGHGPSEAILVCQLVALLLVGRLLGEVLLRLKQPAVMGMLMAGLVLGPSFFGALFPDAQHALFPPAKEQKAMLDAVAQFGVLLILLMTGMETDLKLVKESSRASISASICGIIIPFAMGYTLGEFLPDSMVGDPSKRMITSLFLGAALSIASVKIVATVVREMNFLRRTVGQVILGSAIVDDTIGWIIIAVIFGLALKGTVDPWSIAQSVIGTLAFMAFSLTIGRRLVSLAIRWVNDTFVSEYAVITAILLIMGIMALITDLIGVHTVLGAFVAGILVGESPILTKHIDEQLRGLIIAFFMPVFFGSAGLSADLTVLKDPHLLLLTLGLIAIATIGKFGGAFLGGELGGLSRREALALATGMNARGSTEVIVATVGLSMGALSQNLFTMIVAMAVLTTLAMPPSLRWALSRLPIRKEEKDRLEREEMAAKGFVSKLERLLVAVDDSPNGQFGSRVAGMIAGTRSMPTTVMHITAEKKSATRKTDNETADPKKAEAKKEKEKEEKEKEKDKEDAKSAKDKQADKEAAADAKERADAAAALLRSAAEQMKKRKPKEQKDDKKLDVTVIPDQTTAMEPLAEEAEKGYDLLVIGLDKTTIRDNSGFHPNITQLAGGFDGPLTIVDARDGLLNNPQEAKLSILVPINGTESSRRAAEVAIAMARASRAPVTALYVTPPSSGKSSPRRRADGILKDIVALSDTYDVEAKTAVRSEKLPDQAILKEMAKRKHNLIVMGVERRPGEKLFFGDTATAILEKSDRSIVFVVS